MLVFIVAFLVAETVIIVLMMLVFSLSAGLLYVAFGGNLFISFAHIFIGLFVLTELRVQLFVDTSPY